MKNRKGLLFSILLVYMNSMGVMAALCNVLQMREVWYPQPILFLGGVLFVSIVTALFWREAGRKRLLLWGTVLFGIYGTGIFIFRKEIFNSLAWALDGAVARVNARYPVQLIWHWTMETEEASMRRVAGVSFLAALIPYFLLVGYGVMRSRIIAVILADTFWFVAACSLDCFPTNGAIQICVLGLAAVVIQRAYRDDKRTGRYAVLAGWAVMAVIMWLVSHFMLPVFDEKYEEALDARIKLNSMINEEWIPRLWNDIIHSDRKDPDVGGELTGRGIPEYTGEEIYRVTMDTVPKTTVYLRGFVGKDYSGNEWKPDTDSAFEKYYRDMKWELPEDGRELVNLTFEAFRHGSAGLVRVEELNGKGSYSLYPYGSELTSDYRVHWDGTAKRRGSSYEFPYYAPEGTYVAENLTGEQAETEKRYRSYVYDNFCEYPAEELPELTEFLEESGLRSGELYESLADVLSYLRRNASYNLKTGDPPGGEDFVEYFLFDSHEGYCAHFASSAVLMLRYLGVPARYATGYCVSADEFTGTEDGSYTAVLQDRQAHAWVEVYLDGAGWIPVEMTPGAVAFEGDNTMEQLQLMGQLSGAFDEREDTVPEEQKAEPEKQEAEPQEPESSQESTDRVNGEAGQGNVGISSGQNAGTGTAAETGAVMRKNVKSRGMRWELSPLARATLKTTAGGIICLLCCHAAMYLIRKSCYRRLCRADGREKIGMLYRNLRVLLWVSGHTGRLDGEDRETSLFRLILEKSSFGEKEPSDRELREAMNYCRGLEREEYIGLPFYKKPIYRCLEVYR